MTSLRVVVVDDSALMRRALKGLIEKDRRFEVVGVAANGREALEQVARLSPDLVTLDLEMPEMDGLSVLPRLVKEHRQRVLILSTLATADAYPTFKALALGALDFVSKPGADAYLRNLEDLGAELCTKLAAIADVPRSRIGGGRARAWPAAAASGGLPSGQQGGPPTVEAPRWIVGVGGSTGGTAALEQVLAGLPASFPGGVVAVQHLPPGYSRSLARYLGTCCALRVKEAEEGETLRPGWVYLAPGGRHVRIQQVSGGFRLRTDSVGPPLNGFRPAIDELFYSLAVAARQRAVGVVLSGMGSDGGHGLVAVRSLGGRTLAQDYESCVAPDMPMRAARLGAVQRLASAERIATLLSESTGGG